MINRFINLLFVRLHFIWNILAVLLISSTLYIVFFNLDNDAQHGALVKILFIHVPASWGSLACYVTMGLLSALGLVYRQKKILYVARAFAVPGFVFGILSLLTGILWGKPAWGAWWVWDARLTSMLILCFLYMAYLHFARRDSTLTVAAMVAIIGCINIPIIKGSVAWWATLHQNSSITLTKAPTMDMHYLIPLLMMSFGWASFTLALVGKQLNFRS